MDPGHSTVRGFGVELVESDVGQFGLWEAVAGRLVTAAAERPLLVQIEDLHWADPSTLKLVRHLAETVTVGRLAVTATRRALPEPTGPLAALGESLARRGAARLAVAGLDPAEVRALIEAGTGRPATPQDAEALRDRTDGNAFFLQGRVIEAGRMRSEAARHWLAAGPSHAGRAWRAAAAVAVDAADLHAWDEAGQLLADVSTAHRLDYTATDRERYDLALARADVCRWSGDRTGLDEALMAAIGHADRTGDVELVAAAAVGTVDGSVWHTRPHGQTHPALIAALRDVLRRLPATDSELRCRVMLALAVELYFADAPRERDALVEQGLAVARRLADPPLTVWANIAAHLASWRADTAEDRYRWVVESVDAAIELGDPRQECVTRTILAGIAQETGRVERMWAEIRRARELAVTTGLVSPLVSLGWLEIPWLAMQGRFDQAQQLFAETLTLMQRTTMAQQTESPAGAALALRMAMAAIDDTVVASFEPVVASSPLPMRAHLLMLMLRTGQREQALARYAQDGLEFDHDDWFSLQQQCQAAEAALGLGATGLGDRVYQWLAPYAGRVCCAGAAVALGPVDGYLALAAAAAGEPTVAGRHADDALELCRRWEIPLVAAWLETQRRTHSF